jgi:hypothetical protein
MRQLAVAVVDLDFDAAYMVAASGSTDPVSTFDINGPAPVLYLDLPDGALTSFMVRASSNWFRDGVTTSQFLLSTGVFAQGDKFWFSPAEDVWTATKATGDWHIDASHALINIITIYGGGGVGRVWATGSETVHFSVGPLEGDFNSDDSVDAADYILWRQATDTAGDAGAGQNDPPNPLLPDDYLVWQANFGNGGGAGAPGFASSVVPEPSSIAVLITAFSLVVLRHR